MPNGSDTRRSSTAPYRGSIAASIRWRQSSKSTAQRCPSRTIVTTVPSAEGIWSLRSRIGAGALSDIGRIDLASERAIVAPYLGAATTSPRPPSTRCRLVYFGGMTAESSFSKLDACDLCRAARITPWYHEDDICWIAECEICAVPMVVWRSHGVEPPSDQLAHMH